MLYRIVYMTFHRENGYTNYRYIILIIYGKLLVIEVYLV